MEDRLSQSVQTGLAVFLTIFLIIGVMGNLITIYIIVKNKNLRIVMNAYIINLAVADTILLCVNLPTTIYEFFKGEGNESGKEYCVYTSAVNILTMICALTSVAVVGLNRFIFICLKRNVYARFKKKSSVAVSIAAVWIWSFLITTPPMFGYGKFGYHEKFHTCFFIAYDEKSWMYGTIFCCALGVFPPVCLSTFCYLKIWLKLKETRRTLMLHYTPALRTPGVNLNSKSFTVQLRELIQKIRPNSEMGADQALDERQNNIKLLQRNSKQRKSILMLVTVFAVIIVCWCPISISFIADKKNSLPSVVYVGFVILAWMNSCVNIFIYAGFNKRFRDAYLRLLPHSCAKRLQPDMVSNLAAASSES